jgi:hypothetical protein
MPKDLLTYHGGHVDDSDQGRAGVMEAFGKWFQELGPSLIDPGNPVGRTCTIEPDGAVTEGGANTASGYSIIETEASRRRSSSPNEARSSKAVATVRLAKTVSPM